MVIEWLQFRVEPTERDRFLAQDALIWTPVLAQQPGFLSKECWAIASQPDQIIIVVRWQSQQDWDQVDPELLATTEQAFLAAMGSVYELVETRSYQVLTEKSGFNPQDSI
jgi:uncharacterized protein (TIGR03792 family)